MTAFDNIEKAKAIWRLCVDVPLPDDRLLYNWLTKNPLEDFERACSRIPWRFRNESYDTARVVKFISVSLAWFREQRTATKGGQQ